VIALEKLLSEPYIAREEREMILKEMKKKCRILYQGFLKRGKEIEAKHYQEVMRRYGMEIYIA
jgi:hypothetical protein